MNKYIRAFKEIIPPGLKDTRVYGLLKDFYHWGAITKGHSLYSPRQNKEDKSVTFSFEGEEYKFRLSGGSYVSTLLQEMLFFGGELNGYRKGRKLKSGDCIIDLGAFPGDFSIYAGKIVGDRGKVIAFEPGKENMKVLEDNIRLNGLGERVVIVNKGAWYREETLRFRESAQESHVDKVGGIEVIATDLDSELKRLAVPYESVSFVKVDIEGAELEALKGMTKLLEEGSPFLAIASYHVRDGKQTHEEVEQILKERGFEVKTDFPQHLTTCAWKA